MNTDTQSIERIFGAAIAPAPVTPVPSHAALPVPSAPSVDAQGVSETPTETPAMGALAQFVTDTMRTNYDARETNGVNARLRYAAMAQTCTYDEKQKQYLRDIGIGERTYSPVTSTKIRAAKSMLMELASYGDEIPFAISPTPDPEVGAEVVAEALAGIKRELDGLFAQFANAGMEEIPPEAFAAIMELTKKAAEVGVEEGENRKESVACEMAKKLEKKVWDTFVQGGGQDAILECIDNACTYGTCVLKGPFLRNRAHNKAVRDKDSRVVKIKRTIESVPCYEAINPVDCYPAPGAKEISDGALCVRVRYTRENLWKCRRASRDGAKTQGEEGWRDGAIRKLLTEHVTGVQLTEFPADDQTRKVTANEAHESHDCKFEGIEFFGYVEGDHLLEIGITKSMDGAKVYADEMYYVDVIVIAGTVVFCRIYDERIGCPLSKGVFYSMPGSWWGESIADKLVADQSLMNNAIIGLLRNMGSSSSPMGWISDVSRLVDKSESALVAEPGKIFAFTSSYPGQTGAGAPMGILQIPSNAKDLLGVASFVNKQVDIDSGIPAFSEGTGGSNGGALRTAEGLRTYTEAASRGMKTVISTIDRGVVVETARRTADMLMAFGQDTDLRGDVEVKPVGMMGRILKAQNDQARLQIFNMCLNSQILQQIIGAKGIMELFRPSLKDMNVNPDNVGPSRERLEMVEQIESIKMVFQATQASAGVQENAAQPEGQAGMPSGVSPIQQPGGVAARRGAA